jgi:hypothetical protein
VVAYSGIGTRAENTESGALTNGYKEASILHAADGLGYNYVLGVKTGGSANSYTADFVRNASKEFRFMDEEEAYKKLKVIIDSGRPILVHLDSYYLYDELVNISNFWHNNWKKAHSSHFMVVTGYDQEYVYLDDPTEPDLTIKDMKVSLSNFLKAWFNGDLVTEGAQLGPYWMIYLEWDTEDKVSIEEIIKWNYEISSGAYDAITYSYGEGDSVELGVGRREFGKFLLENGYEEAGEKYLEIGEFYLTDPNPQEIDEIAELEDEARDLLDK